MTSVEIECSQCGSGEYRLLDARTGEVACPYCRNRWIVPELIYKNETEKFLAEQAKRPKVIVNNTTETDRQLMQTLLGILNLPQAISNLIGKLVTGVATILIIIAAIIVISRLLSR